MANEYSFASTDVQQSKKEGFIYSELYRIFVIFQTFSRKRLSVL